MRRRHSAFLLASLLLLTLTSAGAQQPASWTASQRGMRLWGNTFYVGTRGLSAILVTSDEGHVLIDGTLAETAPQVIANIRRLGFRVEDVKLIVNSHPHYDHAGGIAELQRLTGAAVAARAPSVRVLESGQSGPDDPQFGVLVAMTPVKNVRTIADGETVTAGSVELTAHATAGHTRGGTSWSWQSCEDGRCVDIVYADSLTPVSADGFRFTRSQTYPEALKDFEQAYATLAALPCEILITPHPEASGLWDRIGRRDQGYFDAVIDPVGCGFYIETARQRLRDRVQTEQSAP